MSTPKLAAFLLALAGSGALAYSVREDARAPVERATLDYETSRPCVMCHPDHTASWRRTFHRTMTQDATPSSVLGDFRDTSYTYEGVTSRFRRSPSGGFIMETLDRDTGRPRAFEIARTVGSRRVQQYVTRLGDRYQRLPLAWNIEEQRWFHLNGGFLHPDGTDFNAHTSLWDGNCIFCHNTKPNPGYDPARASYASQVAELGIACEACHGPGEAHVKKNSSPLRRYYLHYAKSGDPTIVDPDRLDKTRAVQLCGHCHGQRLPNPPERILEFLGRGDPFTAGEDLSRYTTPIFRETKLAGVELSLRFWRDGTPRLTAYEYQGLLMSKDHEKGELTCFSCHTMHGGDPKGMIEEAMRGPRACASCHPKLVESAAEHAKHRAGSTGTDCYACHMPKIVYGLLEVHPTHHIQRPDPSRAWREHMPEACTLCHLDKSARWAAESMAKQYEKELPADLPEATGAIAESVRGLLGGDVVQRAVAAAALADPRAVPSDARARLWTVPFLLIAMADRYPAIRHFASRSLRAIAKRAGEPELPFFDPEASPAERAAVLAKWRSWWTALDKRAIPHPGPEVPLDDRLEPISEVIEALLRAKIDETIAIGE